MNLHDWHEREMQRNPGYAKEWRDAEESHRRAWQAKRPRLLVALWLGQRLPFDWLPIWANNRLARFMWDTPGFDYDPCAAAERVAPEGA